MVNIRKERYVFIDYMKLFFAYWILLHHVVAAYQTNEYLLKITSFVVGLAVPYFFVTSGFVLYSKINNNYENKNFILREYSKKILIMYIIWTAMMLFFRIPEVIKIGINLKEQFIYWTKLLRIILFIGEYQLWYLIGLLQTIILFCICFKKNKINRCVILAIVLLIIKIMLEVYPHILKENILSSVMVGLYNFVFGTTRNGIFVGYIYFVLGCVIYQYKDRLIKLDKRLIITLSIFSLVLTFVTNYLSLKVVTILLSICVVALMFLLTIVKKEIANNIFIRDISTIIYLVHMIIILLLIDFFNIQNYILAFVICIIASSLVAFVFIKIPSKFKKYLY